MSWFAEKYGVDTRDPDYIAAYTQKLKELRGESEQKEAG